MKIFWSWQSDIDPNISRHFIKGCLVRAVKELNDEAFFDERVEVDHDTKDIPGSPSVTETIFGKIKGCLVFIADVTPIASVQKKEGEKKIMNPNVAIEIGYAISVIGDTKIITVMNEFYGSLNDLPFDLKYKRGPIFYFLKPDSSKDEIKNEEEKLILKFKEALKFYTKIEPEIKDQGNFDLNGPAIFYEKDKPLLRVSEDGWSMIKNKEIFVKMEKSYFYVKIIPKKEFSFQKNELVKSMFTSNQFKINLLFRYPDNTPVINKHGSIISRFDAEDKKYITDFTQVFKNGAIIAISNSFLLYSKNKLFLVNTKQGLERILKEGLNLLKDLTSLSNLDLDIEIGLINKDNCKIVLPSPTGNRAYTESERGPLEEEEYILKKKININEPNKVEELVREFILSLVHDIGMDFDYDEHIWK